jgi:hypothetical protein
MGVCYSVNVLLSILLLLLLLILLLLLLFLSLCATGGFTGDFDYRRFAQYGYTVPASLTNILLL